MSQGEHTHPKPGHPRMGPGARGGSARRRTPAEVIQRFQVNSKSNPINVSTNQIPLVGSHEDDSPPWPFKTQNYQSQAEDSGGGSIALLEVESTPATGFKKPVQSKDALGSSSIKPNE